MKAILLVFTCFLLMKTANCQSADEAIKSVYGEAWYSTELNENPQMIQLLRNFHDRGIQIENCNPDKYLDYPELTEIPLRSKSGAKIEIASFLNEFENNSLSPLSLGFFPQKEAQFFRLQGHNKKILVVLSLSQLKE